MQMPNFFLLTNTDGRTVRYQSVGSGTRPGAALFTDGRGAFVEAATAVVERAGELYCIARVLVQGKDALTVKISRDHFGARKPAVGNVGMVLPQHDADGRLFSRLWFPLSHSNRAETW